MTRGHPKCHQNAVFQTRWSHRSLVAGFTVFCLSRDWNFYVFIPDSTTAKKHGSWETHGKFWHQPWADSIHLASLTNQTLEDTSQLHSPKDRRCLFLSHLFRFWLLWYWCIDADVGNTGNVLHETLNSSDEKHKSVAGSEMQYMLSVKTITKSTKLALNGRYMLHTGGLQHELSTIWKM